MKNVGKSATIPDSRLSEQIATNDDAAANEEEVNEQIEEDNVEKAARENETRVPASIMISNEEMEAADDAVASREEIEEEAEESRIDKVAFVAEQAAPLSVQS
jgi:regulatory protein YycH of two-component signal transduction system YycFG